MCSAIKAREQKERGENATRGRERAARSKASTYMKCEPFFAARFGAYSLLSVLYLCVQLGPGGVLIAAEYGWRAYAC